MIIDNDEFVSELLLSAKNTGSTYGDAEAATDLAFAEFCSRRREDEIETMSMERDRIVSELSSYWESVDGE